MDSQDLYGNGPVSDGAQDTPDHNPAAFDADAYSRTVPTVYDDAGGDDQDDAAESGEPTTPDPRDNELETLRAERAQVQQVIAAIQARQRENATAEATAAYEAERQRRREQAEQMAPDEQLEFLDRAHREDLQQVRAYFEQQRASQYEQGQLGNMARFIDEYGQNVRLADTPDAETVALDDDNRQIVRNMLQAAPPIRSEAEALRFGKLISDQMRVLANNQKRLAGLNQLNEKMSLNNERNSRLSRGADAVSGGGGARAPKTFVPGSNAHLEALMSGRVSQ